MAIQWFPGHMASARKQAAKTMAYVDVVVEVLDARIPVASCNPMIDELRRHRQRPSLKLLNKADLADPVATAEWLAYYRAQPGVEAMALSCTKPGDVAKIAGLAQKLAPHRDDNVKPLRLMIMGIPNVGKSTLMNAMVKRRVANVGDQPAVTKSEQRIDISSRLTLYDTPGMLWPKIQYASDGLMLAASHAVGTNAVIEEEVAAFLADILLARYPEMLEKRYGLKAAGMDGVSVLEAVAVKRACRKKGGDLDLEKASLVLLTDYRSGTLGRISLETPSTRAAMIAASVAASAAAEADKDAEPQQDDPQE